MVWVRGSAPFQDDFLVTSAGFCLHELPENLGGKWQVLSLEAGFEETTLIAEADTRDQGVKILDEIQKQLISGVTVIDMTDVLVTVQKSQRK